MKKLSAATAFSLVELTLALGIAAFCLIAVFGLVPVAVLTNRNATSQTAANNIIASVIADMRGTPNGVTPSAQFAINLPANCRKPSGPAAMFGELRRYILMVKDS